jgi:hypothetical protein
VTRAARGGLRHGCGPGCGVALPAVDDLWGDAVPDTAVKMVQIYVSQLRKLLPADVLLTRPPGYLVQVDQEAIDIVRFDRLRRTGRAALEAGEALAEFVEPFAQTERNHLDELRLACLEDRVEADLMQGRHAELVRELAAEVARFPLRERLHKQSMLFGFCRSHYASVLIWRGEWNDAEAELTAASRAFEHGAPALVFESILRLAELRRRQNRPGEAAELCERIAWHPAAQLCLAEIALDRGDAPAAADLVARHRRALPTGERLGRAPGLELTVRVHLAMQDLPAAEAGVKELQELADAAGTAPLRASLRFSRGLLARARGDSAAAKGELQDAVGLWSRMRAPYELARGHIALAELARQTNRPEEAAHELRRARSALHGLAAPTDLERAEALLARAHADSPYPRLAPESATRSGGR